MSCKNNHCCQYSSELGLWTLAIPGEHTCGLSVLLDLFCLFSWSSLPSIIKFDVFLLPIKEGFWSLIIFRG